VTSARHDPPPHRYRIRVRGRLGPTIRCAFPALQARASGADTVLTGPLRDRAALYGVLAQIEALGLGLLEVRRLPGSSRPADELNHTGHVTPAHPAGRQPGPRPASQRRRRGDHRVY
jgi:hypothetical protein